MFGKYVYTQSEADYYNHIILIDDENLEGRTDYSKRFKLNGFDVVKYEGDLAFRIDYEEEWKHSNNKILVIASSDSYIPFDILKIGKLFKLSYKTLFPLLNPEVTKSFEDLNLDLLCLAYRKNYDNLQEPEETLSFIKKQVYGRSVLEEFLRKESAELIEQAKVCKDYKKWLLIAEKKAEMDVLAAKYSIDLDTSEINSWFRDWVKDNFGKLYMEINRDTPVLVSKAMEYMHERSSKFIIVVMDCMSEFDWKVISSAFKGINFIKNSVYAMIPTVTCISRQCLLSNKSPNQLIAPWTQTKEKDEFINCANEMGLIKTTLGDGDELKKKQIYDRYIKRSYDAEFSTANLCGAVIIKDIDDIVHGQKQGKKGMYKDMRDMQLDKMVAMVKRFLKQGFDVYISADHGNTLTTGRGQVTKKTLGEQVATRSKRMLVLNNVVDIGNLVQDLNLIEFPKYYLDKKYNYLICDTGVSFEAKGEEALSHGGITIDEVVVPFVTIKAVDNCG